MGAYLNVYCVIGFETPVWDKQKPFWNPSAPGPVVSKIIVVLRVRILDISYMVHLTSLHMSVLGVTSMHVVHTRKSSFPTSKKKLLTHNS